ncbi:YciI family protein [Kocuria sp.]|uniref:YciI family protein n=1 Tax=Kocuria sp. TaxID=1871328 RepID=UPI0026DF97DA|nr:YciI family protein [Kocuria sp.]MDO5619013.1 YciI family protein [Kocuria sp.]
MSQFFISVNHTDDAGLPDGVALEDLHAAVMAFNQKMLDEQRVVFIGALEQPATAAQVVDASGAEPVISSGTASGAPIQLGGFWILEAKSREEALDLGAQASAACHQPVEVRQMQS